MPNLNLIPHPLTGTPFGAALDLCLIVAVLMWLYSVIRRDYSGIDRAWQICPPVYCLMVAFAAGFQTARVNLMTALVIVWGGRLVYNHYRKGGFRKGGEDYRWAHVQEQYGPVGFQILNVTFITPGQMLIIWLFTSPIHKAWLPDAAPLGWLDLAAAILFIGFFACETVADNQMWAFQQDKKRRIAAGEEVEQPFMNRGLFRYCRHPNYLGELGMWWVFYLFSVAASGEWINWTGLGFLLLTPVFTGSIRLTESISAERYPSYAEYQATTPCLIPGLRRRPASAVSDDDPDSTSSA